jgi:hypothetical protein
MAEITNWYDKIGINNNNNKLPVKWKNHCIYHICIGGTGTGKNHPLIDYLSSSSGGALAKLPANRFPYRILHPLV